MRGRQPFTREDLQAVESRMREIVQKDAPITPMQVSLRQAMELFRNRGEDDKARLLAHRQKDTVTLYTLRNRKDYFQGFISPPTEVYRSSELTCETIS